MDKEDILLAQVDLQLFDVFWQLYGNKSNVHYDFVRNIFTKVDARYKLFLSESKPEIVLINSLNVYDISIYIIEEHKFYINHLEENKIVELENNQQYINSLCKMVFDKLIYNDFNNIKNKSVNTKYAVEISTLNMFINRLFNLLFTIKTETIKDRLLFDIFTKLLMLIKSCLNQLTDGLETEAMSSWRTLHELECVLKIIYDSDEEVSKAYYRHLEYGAYHRNEINDPNKIKIIEENISKDMELLEVKKSNREKFINYGWLHWVKKYYKDEEIKFNFLGGVQKLADLTSYKKWYEIASDVTHSTPLLVYAGKNFLYNSTLKITYESFFRIETLLFNFALTKYDTNSLVVKDYLNFKAAYKAKIELIYQQVSSRIKTNKDYLEKK